jgi:4-amino-4-deoxy-L-arabinose transferase-like glycosyltransferase
MQFRVPFAIFLIAFAVRLFFFYIATTTVGIEALLYGDAVGQGGYIPLARHLAQGLGFTQYFEGNIVPEVFRTIGLPWILSFFVQPLTNLWFYFIGLMCITSMCIGFVFYPAVRSLLGAQTALIASVLVTFEPHHIFFSFLPQTEMPLIILLICALTLIVHISKNVSSISSIALGIVLGLSMLVRPSMLPLVALSTLLAILVAMRLARTYVVTMFIVVIACTATISPSLIRMHSITGTFALSGAGWRNLYSDYLASVRSLEKNTSFSEEKALLLKYAESEWGITTYAIDAPQHGPVLRAYALKELSQRMSVVIKLQTYLTLSVLTHDGYYYAFRKFGILPSEEKIHISPSALFLQKGLHAVPEIWAEAREQYFIPIIGRISTYALLVLALIGFYLRRNLLTGLLFFFSALSIEVGTVIGFGVESRMRLPVQFILYMFAAHALVFIFIKLKRMYETRRLYTGI